jgi:hypothetical protein
VVERRAAAEGVCTSSVDFQIPDSKRKESERKRRNTAEQQRSQIVQNRTELRYP